MTIENIEKVDGVGIDKKSGEVVLTISDHLTWIDDAAHFRLIEKKIGRYLDFVKTGQLIETLPEADKRQIRINVICQHQPTDSASKFLLAAQGQLKKMGIGFSFGSLPGGF